MKLEQFFSDGFGERKIQFLIDFATIIIAKHTTLTQMVPKPRKYNTDMQKSEEVKKLVVEHAKPKEKVLMQGSPKNTVKYLTNPVESVNPISNPDLSMIGALLLDLKMVSTINKCRKLLNLIKELIKH